MATKQERIAAQARAREERLIELLRAIDAAWRVHGHGPAVRDLMRPLRVTSTANVTYWLHQAAEQGLVVWTAEKARTLRLTERGSELLDAWRRRRREELEEIERESA